MKHKKEVEILQLIPNKKYKNIYDIKLSNIEQLKNYSAIELSFFVYPLDRAVNSESFKILPFEEYINDVDMGKRSTYQKIDFYADKIFGLTIAFCIFFFFLRFNPSDLYSIESVVSMLAAYAIGKDFWTDLENLLIKKTNGWKVSFREEPYYYQKQNFGTIQKYWEQAREKRYGQKTILPTKLDLINHSNSKTIEMLFKRKDLLEVKENNLHIASLHINKLALKEFEKSYIFGTKLSLNKQVLFLSVNNEIFEMNDSTKKIQEAKYKRNTVSIGKIKIYR